ncbi:hypothetical protein GQ42DRAFT_172503 [Ramicandelaber brevisporus]|nr:hypothetical protein GQ42DRAFT_172503 [Ramicandelaber brevisporus]
MKVSAAALALSAATAAVVSAGTKPNGGLLSLFSGPGFTGSAAMMALAFNDPSSECVSFSSFDNIALSAKWNINADSGATITFTENADCTGASKTWIIADKDFPTNFELDGLKGKISAARIRY